MAHILITGGAGFIGAHVTRLALAAGHRIRLLDNLSPQVHGDEARFEPPPGVEFIRGDINLRGDLERALDGVETIVHLAAETGTGQSMYDIDRYYRVNVQGTALLLDVLTHRNHSVQSFILASSRSVYGEGAYICRECDPSGARRFPPTRTLHQLAACQWTPLCPICAAVIQPTATREDDNVAPASIYASSKLAQEDLVRVACGALGIGHTVFRFQNVFGEGQSLTNPYTGILSIFSTRIRLGQSLPIFEDGEELRDFIHVEDVARAVLCSIERQLQSGTVNVGSGTPISIFAVAELLRRTMGSSIEPHVTGQYRVGDIRHNFADIARLKHVVGFRPAIPIEAGMRRFCEWVITQPVPEDMLDQANAELAARKMMG